MLILYLALVILLGTLLMKKILGKEQGVSVGTQPLSIIMEEKMNDKLVPTAVLSMEGQLKRSTVDEDEATLSSPEDEVLSGAFPCLIGHPESWASAKGRFQNLQSLPRFINNYKVNNIFSFLSVRDVYSPRWFVERPFLIKTQK